MAFFAPIQDGSTNTTSSYASSPLPLSASNEYHNTTRASQSTVFLSATSPTSDSTAIAHFRDVFLPNNRDIYGHVLSVIWYLSPIGFTGAHLGCAVVNQYSCNTRAYGIIRDYITQDGTHALYRVRIEGWTTVLGHYKPPCDTFAFLLAPDSGPSTQATYPAVPWPMSHVPYRLVDDVHGIAREVRQVEDCAKLVYADAATSAFAATFSLCPIMRMFSPDKDHGVAVCGPDLIKPLNYWMSMPMPEFDFKFDIVEVGQSTNQRSNTYTDGQTGRDTGVVHVSDLEYRGTHYAVGNASDGTTG